MSSLDSVRCILIEKQDDQVSQQFSRVARSQFDTGDVTIKVQYSSLNYKDSLATQGHPGIVRRFPHVPGIDLAGTVVDSQTERFKIGDQVIATGYDLGQGHWGGWSQLACVPADWLVPLPATLSPFESMVLGTAGFTAAQCLIALQRNEIRPESGPVAVTGATGGVGSLAVSLLARAGYEVVAITGKLNLADQLREIGARRVIDRGSLTASDPKRPMLSAQWAGAVDTVGGDILVNLLKSTQYGGCVAACGLVAGAQLEMTVYPFLLRGVSLCGVASADCPMNKRLEIWSKLAMTWKPDRFDRLVTEVRLEQVLDQVELMRQGRLVGRVVINCQAD